MRSIKLRLKKSALNTEQPPLLWDEELLEQGTPHPAPQKQETGPSRLSSSSNGPRKPRAVWASQLPNGVADRNTRLPRPDQAPPATGPRKPVPMRNAQQPPRRPVPLADTPAIKFHAARRKLPTRLGTVEDLARRWRMSPKTITNNLSSGRLKLGTRILGHVRFDIKEMVEYEKQQRIAVRTRKDNVERTRGVTNGLHR